MSRDDSQGLLLCLARWSRAIVFETQGGTRNRTRDPSGEGVSFHQCVHCAAYNSVPYMLRRRFFSGSSGHTLSTKTLSTRLSQKPAQAFAPAYDHLHACITYG